MPNDSIIKAAFIISLTGHYVFLGLPGFNFPSSRVEKCDEIMVRIEVEKLPLLPKVDILGQEKKIKEVLEEAQKREPEPKPRSEEIVAEKVPEEPVEEKVEVIDPAYEAMFRYQDMVKQRIEEARRYPAWAKKQGIEGVIAMTFTVLSDGSVRDIKIIGSSGYKILDDEAVNTVKRASPFPSIPKEITFPSIQMEVSVVYTLR